MCKRQLVYLASEHFDFLGMLALTSDKPGMRGTAQD